MIRVDGSTRLRPWTVEDVVPLYEAVMVDQEHVARWLRWADGIYTTDRADEFIANTLLNYRNETGEHLTYTVEVDGRVAGGIGVPRSVPEDREFEIGYWLSKPHTGHGIMTRSAEALTDFLFRERAAHRVQIAALAGNAPSRAIAERLGLTLEGVFRRARWNRGEWNDLAWYAVTEEEWASRKQAASRDA